jgi:uncharacterized protein
MRWLLMALVRLYQVTISPMLGPTCRYYPSCSHYALKAVGGHGAIRGSWLAARRLARCHPWTPGGVDLVPAPGDYRWWGPCPGSDPDESITRTPDSRAVGSTREGAPR